MILGNWIPSEEALEQLRRQGHDVDSIVSHNERLAGLGKATQEIEEEHQKALAGNSWLAERALRLSQQFANPRMMTVHPWFRGQP